METTERRKDLSGALLEKATNAATTAVERNSVLRGQSARVAAMAVLHAAGDDLRTAHSLKLADNRNRDVVALLALAVTALAVDVGVIGYIAVKGGRGQRIAGALSIAAHLALFGLARWRTHRTAVAARADLEAASVRVPA